MAGRHCHSHVARRCCQGCPRIPLCQALLLLRAIAAHGSTRSQCDAVEELTARQNPGNWVPAFVFRSVYATSAQLHPPKRKELADPVRFPGLCNASSLQADLFTWQKPTEEGGEWISTTSGSTMVEVATSTYRCPLTGIAVASTGWPSLRLQFEECPRKVAVEVPLTNATASYGGTELVDWMCHVTANASLCTEATARLAALGAAPKAWGNQTLLNLSPMAAVLSHGVTRMQVHNECFEPLDWLIANNPLAVNDLELKMLTAMAKILAPNPWPAPIKIPADVTVQTVCVEDCQQAMPTACKPIPPPALQQRRIARIAPMGAPDTRIARSLAASFEVFARKYQDRDILPWFAAFCIGFFFLGSALACCCPVPSSAADLREERRIKKVSVVYREVPEESAYFSR